MSFVPQRGSQPPRPGGFTLYGMTRSYFTRKLEAALHFYGAEFEFCPKNRENRQVLEMRAGTHQVPVLHTPENWMLADTTPIMAMLDQRFPDRAMFPRGALGFAVHLLEDYFDEWLARTAVHWRWNYPEQQEALALELADGDVEVAEKIAAWGLRACRATGVSSPHQGRAAEQEYHRLMGAAEAQLKETPYLMGHRPTAVDCVFLGGLRAHFNYDPVPRREMTAYPLTLAWAEGGADQWQGGGDLAPLDRLTPFAQRVLAEMNDTYTPFVLGNEAALKMGKKAFEVVIYDERVSYLARPYIGFAATLLHDHLARLTQPQREAVRSWLGSSATGRLFFS